MKVTGWNKVFRKWYTAVIIWAGLYDSPQKTTVVAFRVEIFCFNLSRNTYAGARPRRMYFTC